MGLDDQPDDGTMIFVGDHAECPRHPQRSLSPRHWRVAPWARLHDALDDVRHVSVNKLLHSALLEKLLDPIQEYINDLLHNALEVLLREYPPWCTRRRAAREPAPQCDSDSVLEGGFAPRSSLVRKSDKGRKTLICSTIRSERRSCGTTISSALHCPSEETNAQLQRSLSRLAKRAHRPSDPLSAWKMRSLGMSSGTVRSQMRCW